MQNVGRREHDEHVIQTDRQTVRQPSTKLQRWGATTTTNEIVEDSQPSDEETK